MPPIFAFAAQALDYELGPAPNPAPLLSADFYDQAMKIYLISLAAGMLMGVIYALINVRSPAPPAIALIGLLGMLIGEQIVPVAKRLISDQAVSVSWFSNECAPKITGLAPRRPHTDGDTQPPSA